MYGHMIYLYWICIREEGRIVKSTAGVKDVGGEEEAEYKKMSLVTFQPIIQ
jgi:hypothetical protein